MSRVSRSLQLVCETVEWSRRVRTLMWTPEFAETECDIYLALPRHSKREKSFDKLYFFMIIHLYTVLNSVRVASHAATLCN